MKRVISILAVLFFGTILALSQPLEKSLLWKITGPGFSTPSHLYGTYHLLCPDDLVISDAALRALEQSERVVLELDFDDPGLMTAMQQGMFMADGTTAKDYLDEEEYALVSDFFTSKMGIPFEQLAAVKPFFLSSMTLIYFLDCQPASPEMHFTKMAGDQEMEVLGLETIEEQIGFIDNIPVEDAATMLVAGIKELEEGQELSDRVVRAYLEGDLEKLELIMDEYLGGDYTKINDDLVVARNEGWIPKIENLITEKPSFIAVGAGHLPGEKGVIQLLRNMGYAVEAVK